MMARKIRNVRIPIRVIEMRLRAFGLRGCDVFRGNGRHRNATNRARYAYSLTVTGM
jgi:hypothetical protein